MRHYIQISARHKLLVINRAYLAHAGPKEARARAHDACVQNAPMQSLWTIPYHSVAAAVVLALDMIKLGSDGSGSSLVLRERKHEIHRATQALQRLAPTSRIARRGLQVREISIVPLQVLIDTGTFRSSRGDQRSISRIGT
jgi:hypothetical protein